MEIEETPKLPEGWEWDYDWDNDLWYASKTNHISAVFHASGYWEIGRNTFGRHPSRIQAMRHVASEHLPHRRPVI